MAKRVFILVLLSILFLSGKYSYASPIDSTAKTDENDSLFSYMKVHSDNLIYVEVIGNGGILSYNYERFFGQNASLRIGLSSLPLREYPNDGKNWFHTTYGVLAMVDYYFLPYADVGVGTNVLLNSEESCNIGLFKNVTQYNCSSLYFTARLGVRWIPDKSGTTFSLAFTPFINFSPFSVQPWVGFSIGYAF